LQPREHGALPVSTWRPLGLLAPASAQTYGSLPA